MAPAVEVFLEPQAEGAMTLDVKGPADAECLFESAISDQLLVEILDRLSPADIVGAAALVNRRWAAAASCSELWRARFAPGLPEEVVAEVSNLRCGWSRTWFGLYCSNLLSNPYLLQALQRRDQETRLASPMRTHFDTELPWMTTARGGHGWAWEQDGAVGMQADQAAHLPLPLPCYYPVNWQEVEGGKRAGVVAGSYRWSELVQAVDLSAELQARGLSPHAAAALLDAMPPLLFSAYYGGRADASGVVRAKVVLDDGKEVLPVYHSRQDFPWDRSALKAGDSGSLRCSGGTWQQLQIELVGYPPGVRRALVVLGSMDEMFWAGHYGGKWAAPQLHFAPPHSKQEVFG